MGRDTLIARLKQEIAAGRAVIVAGTGVSRAACAEQLVEGFAVATWPGLIEHGAQHCQALGVASAEDVEILKRQLKTGDTRHLIAAADDISQRMLEKSPGVFLNWLASTVGQLELRRPALPVALANLHGVLATLNYDDLLEQASERTAITWRDADDVQELLRGESARFVLHLHGWFKRPDFVVFGRTSYGDVLRDAHAQAVQQLFTLDRTLVFVGCGDTVLDPNFTRLIEWGRRALEYVQPRHYLLCRTAQLGEFCSKLSKAPWLQVLDYGADYPELLPFLEQLAPPACSLPAATRVSPEMSDLDGYSQAVRKFYARLKLEQLDPSTYDASLTLTGMFIPQHARECIEFLPRAFDLPKELPWQLLEQSELEVSLLDPEELERHRRGYLAQAPRPILELMATLSRLVILGDPGSGKSTLLQYLLLHWAEAAPGADGCGLPLLVELGDYARLRQLGRVHDFLEYLHQGSSVPWRFERSALAAWLDNQPSLLLFDGLDEVIDPALRRETVTAIQRLVAEYPRARIVVTSRVIGFQHQAWRDHGFQHVMLEEFDGAQIEDFLRRWHERAYELPARRKAKEELLRSSIAESGAISQLARNPLLLTMMAIVNRTQDLPRDRAELYEQCARLLLHHWKADLALANDPRLGKASLDFKDKRLLLMRVARAMQREPGSIGANLIEESALENALASGLVDVRQVEPQQAARALIQQLRGRNFMLSSLGGRAYAFVHRSFLEYFCALEICERFQAERTLTPKQLQTEIFGHWRDEAWEEVLCLLAGMLAPRFVAGVLDFLRRQKANGAIFLAGRCVGEVRDRDALGAAADRILKALKRRATMGTWVAPVVGVITGQHFTYPFNVRALRLIASVWSSTPGTREWVSEQVSNSVLRRFAVEVLAETWGGDPEAFAVLQNAVYQEPLEAWRTLWVIGENCRDNPQTLPFIKTFSQTGPAYIRDQALSVLADVWKDAPETLVFIKQRVESEFAQGGAFCAATQVLLHHWGPSEALPLVRSIATSSGDPAARERVLKVLAHWNSERTFDSSLRTKACRLIEELQGPP